jgi:hypothetical protein
MPDESTASDGSPTIIDTRLGRNISGFGVPSRRVTPYQLTIRPLESGRSHEVVDHEVTALFQCPEDLVVNRMERGEMVQCSLRENQIIGILPDLGLQHIRYVEKRDLSSTFLPGTGGREFDSFPGNVVSVDPAYTPCLRDPDLRFPRTARQREDAGALSIHVLREEMIVEAYPIVSGDHPTAIGPGPLEPPTCHSPD